MQQNLTGESGQQGPPRQRLTRAATSRVRAIFRRKGAVPTAYREEDGPAPLRNLVARGGMYLLGREGIGMLIRLAGVVLTLRWIGPHDYGIYSGAAAFVLVVIDRRRKWVPRFIS